MRLLFSFACLVLFAVWGSPAQAQCPLVCNDNVNISLPGPTVGCSLEVNIDMVLEDPGPCDMLVNLMTLQGLPLATSGPSRAGATPVRDSHVGGEEEGGARRAGMLEHVGWRHVPAARATCGRGCAAAPSLRRLPAVGWATRARRG